jgi:hypothetical protein
MLATRLTVDGLWRTLCPSFDALLIFRLSAPLRSPSTRPCPRNATPTLQHPRRCPPARLLHGSTLLQTRPGTHVQNWKFSGAKTKSSQIVDGNDAYKSLEDVPTTELHNVLRQLRTSGNAYGKIVNVVEYLVAIRGERPSLIHYDALIFANADPQRGSAEVVAQLWLEMEQEGIVPDSGLHHSALHVCFTFLKIRDSAFV